jgi:aminoglycoside 6'-N-acetyltransferase I
MNVRRATTADRREYQRMRLALWPDCDESDIDSWFARDDAATFLAERPDGSLCGFVEVGSRPYGEDCLTSPVGYIEGWWVDADVRRNGVGRALLGAAEDWARAKGYREIASDALLENTVSHEAHRRCGYQETVRVVNFRKAL